MNSKLAVGLATFISGLAIQLSSVTSGWNSMLTPQFVSGMLIQLAGFILSVWGGIETKPSRDNKRTRAEDIVHDAEIRKAVEEKLDEESDNGK